MPWIQGVGSDTRAPLVLIQDSRAHGTRCDFVVQYLPEPFARFSHGRGDENTNGLMPDVRGLWLRVQTNIGVQHSFAETQFWSGAPLFLHTGEIGTPEQKELNAKVDKQGSNPLNRMEGIEPA